MVVPGLCCCMQAFSNCSEWGLLFLAVHGFLIVVASLIAEHGLLIAACGLLIAVASVVANDGL